MNLPVFPSLDDIYCTKENLFLTHLRQVDVTEAAFAQFLNIFISVGISHQRRSTDFQFIRHFRRRRTFLRKHEI